MNRSLLCLVSFLCLSQATSLMSMRPQGAGGNPPAWSDAFLTLQDGFNNVVNSGLQALVATHAAGKAALAGLLTYVAWKSAPGVTQDLQTAPEKIKELIKQTQKKIRALRKLTRLRTRQS